MKVSPIPKWIQKRYAKIYQKLDNKEFTHNDLKKVLRDGDKTINVIISELRKANWIVTKFDEEDYRKRKYTLKEPNEIYKQI